MKKGITFGRFDLFHAGHVLMVNGIQPRQIRAIILTHCHADHDAGRPDPERAAAHDLVRQPKVRRQHLARVEKLPLVHRHPEF